jgi:small subunit ribosomal protein S25
MIFAYNAENGSCTNFPHHKGLFNFVYWHLPQLKYKNPEVQMVTLKMITPTPWIKAFFDDDLRILIDCDSRSREEIHDHIKKILGRSESMLKHQVRETSMLESNPANFGSAFPHNCICEVPGQVPCPGWQPLPLEMTGKGKRKLKEMEAESSQQ